MLVDHVIIIGNERTSTETIERELLLRPGEPLGYSARLESQQRLSALGLFRRVSIIDLAHAAEPRRDVLVQVEEAPPTTIGYGGGLEGGSRLRPRRGRPGGRAVRVRPARLLRDRPPQPVGQEPVGQPVHACQPSARATSCSPTTASASSDNAGGLGFNEYRVYGTFREPRVLNSRADLLVTGILDQAIRASFNFITREVRAETGLRLSPRYSVAGRYSFEHTELFDETFTEDEKPLIDRLFPQVRLSKFSGSLIRDGRDDVLDPSTGRFLDRRRRSGDARHRFRSRFRQDLPAGVLVHAAADGAAHRAGARRPSRRGARFLARGAAAGHVGEPGHRTRRRTDRRCRPGPAGERTLLRRRRHDRARLLARSARQCTDD